MRYWSTTPVKASYRRAAYSMVMLWKYVNESTIVGCALKDIEEVHPVNSGTICYHSYVLTCRAGYRRLFGIYADMGK